MVQLIPLLVEGFPGSFNSNKDFTIFWQLATFYKKQRKADAEAKKAEADARKALLDKKAQDTAKKDAEARVLAGNARAASISVRFLILSCLNSVLIVSFEGSRQER